MKNGLNIIKIAVTGSAGSGKSLLCRHFKTIGLVTLDCDVIARQVVEPGTRGFKKVVALFGKKIINKKGFLDRAELRSIIVENPELRKKMEETLHPLINKEMVFQMENAEYKEKNAVAVEVPLLFELDLSAHFDTTITVVAEDHELVKRICKRDSVKEKDALKMLDLQMSQQDKISMADHVVINQGDPSELFASVECLFEKIQKEFLTT